MGKLTDEEIAKVLNSPAPIISKAKTSISPSLLIFWITVSFLVTLTSTIIPSYRASNKSVIEAINTYAPRQIKANPLIWDGWDKMMEGILKRRQESMKSFFDKDEEY